MSSRKCRACSAFFSRNLTECPECNAPLTPPTKAPPQNETQPTPAPRVPWSERVAAYDRVKPRLEKINFGEPWTSERIIAHWRKVQADPDAIPSTRRMASEALQNLGAGIQPEAPEADHDPTAEASFREPGQDDEETPRELSAQPPQGTTAAAEDQAQGFAASIPEDVLEAAFRAERPD